MSRLLYPISGLAILVASLCHAQPLPRITPPPKALFKRVQIQRTFDSDRATRVIAYLERIIKEEIEFDRSGLESVSKKSLDEIHLSLRQQVVPLGIVIEQLANQVGGTVS